jgi:putative ABC transport system substrate-binding protein
MRRRAFITLIIGAITTRPFAATAQQAGRMYRVGILFATPRSHELVTAFLDPARRQGFIEGQNLTVDYREYAPHLDLLSEWAAELVKVRVDVIAAAGEFAIRAVQTATRTIPILGITDDMLGSGLVNSMARPNGNTTRVSILAGELDGKRQEFLIEAVPGLRRMAVLADSSATPVAKLEALRDAARVRNIELSIHRIAKGEEIAAAIDMAQASGARALNVLASPLLYANRRLVFDRATALMMPAIYQWPEMAEEGGFAAYGPSLIETFREPYGRQLVQLFRGTKPTDMPVEQPTKFSLVINLKTAKALGLTTSESFLARADEVIE